MSTNLAIEFDDIFGRLLRDVGSNPERWKQLAGLVDDLPPSRFPIALEVLGKVDLEQWSDEQRRYVWSALRDSAARHLRFPTAVWAMPVESATALLRAADRFQPQDPLQRVAWLFAPHVELPIATDLDWEAHEARVAEARMAAVVELWDRGGYDELLKLCEQVEAPWTVGVALADAGLVKDLLPFIESSLQKEDDRLVGLVRAFLSRTADKVGGEVIRQVLTDSRSGGWPSDWRAVVYSCLAFSSATWQAVETEGRDISSRYWHLVPLFGRGDIDSETVTIVVGHLLEAGNFAAAVDFCALYSRKANPQLILAMLEGASAPEISAGVPWDRLGRDVLTLLEVLHSSSEIDQDRVATLEWRFVPFVRGLYEPRALERKLSSDPQFFMEILTLAFRAAGESADPKPPDDVKARASRAIQLLWAWRIPPGTTASGDMDAAALNDWVSRVRVLAEEAGRSAVADLQLGQVMAYAQPGTDDIWPSEAVRDLIERLASEEFDRGLVIGIHNSRGVTTRALGAGGGQERDLAAKYAAYATAVRDRWPRTSTVLSRIAESYERHARREDVEAEMERREVRSEEPSAE